MNHRDIAAIVAGIAPRVREIIAGVADGLSVRIKAIEERAPVTGDSGKDGAPGRDGKDGLDGKEGTAGAAGLAGMDGKDGAPGERGADGSPGRDGVDGKDGAAGRDGIDGKDGERGPEGPAGMDGTAGLDGKDGAAARDGRDGLPGLQGEKGIDGKDGRDGIDGRDGFSLDDFDVRSDDDGRTLVFSFTREGQEPIVRTIKTALVLERGVWREGPYEKGDGVTWGGSFFIAQRATQAKPDTPDSGWRLAVKRGRDGASAFDVARKAGFKGSEREWLDSLRPGPAKPVKVG